MRQRGTWLGSSRCRTKLTAVITAIVVASMSDRLARPVGGSRVCRTGDTSQLEPLDVTRGDGFRRVGVALDVSLRAVSQPSFELVGVGAGGAGELEGEGMA